MKIKTIPEDFKVTELSSSKLKNFDEIEGSKFAYFLLLKKSWNTVDVINKISSYLKIDSKKIGFAGNKDKIAITQQYISIPVSSERNIEYVENLKIKDVCLKYVGCYSKRLTLGDLEGNKFEIVVRDLNSEFELHFDKLKNYFGEQRFSKNNVEIGRAILKNNFKLACELLNLPVEGKEYVNALRKFDRRTLRLILSSYQSWLWNEVAEIIEDVDTLEVIGFLTKFNNEHIKKTYEDILSKENVVLKDFIISSFKELSLEGSERELYMCVQNFNYSWLEDELNPGRKKCLVNFELGKGSYATVLLKQLFF
jgi:tRNA pseudouridine13 synthase